MRCPASRGGAGYRRGVAHPRFYWGKTGNVLEKQLINVGTAWEEKFKASTAQELAHIQQSGMAAKIGGYCIFGAGILALTYELVKFAFWLTGHKV